MATKQPNLNSVDYKILNDVDQPKQHPMDVWHGMGHGVLGSAIYESRIRLQVYVRPREPEGNTSSINCDTVNNMLKLHG